MLRWFSQKLPFSRIVSSPKTKIPPKQEEQNKQRPSLVNSQFGNRFYSLAFDKSTFIFSSSPTDTGFETSIIATAFINQTVKENAPFSEGAFSIVWLIQPDSNQR